MLFKKKKKRKSGVKKKQRFNLKEFFTVPIIILSILTFIFFSSFIYQLNKKDESRTSIVDLEKLLRKNSYEQKTGHRIQIEVLNGCGERFVAKMYQDFLRYEGFDVMDARNSNSKYKNTTIYIHRGDTKMATYLSSVIGINDSLILKDIDESLMFDLTLVLGDDYSDLVSYNSAISYHPNKLLILE